MRDNDCVGDHTCNLIKLVDEEYSGDKEGRSSRNLNVLYGMYKLKMGERQGKTRNVSYALVISTSK